MLDSKNMLNCKSNARKFIENFKEEKTIRVRGEGTVGAAAPPPS